MISLVKYVYFPADEEWICIYPGFKACSVHLLRSRTDAFWLRRSEDGGNFDVFRRLFQLVEFIGISTETKWSFRYWRYYWCLQIILLQCSWKYYCNASLQLLLLDKCVILRHMDLTQIWSHVAKRLWSCRWVASQRDALWDGVRECLISSDVTASSSADVFSNLSNATWKSCCLLHF